MNEKKLKLNSSLFALELFALYNRAHWQVTKKKKKKKSNFYNKKKLTPAWPNDGNSQWNEHRDRRKPNSLRGGCVPLQRRRRRYIRPDCCCCCCCCCCYNPLTGQLILCRFGYLIYLSLLTASAHFGTTLRLRAVD